MAVNTGIFIVAVAVTIASLVGFSFGSPLPGIRSTTPPTNIRIRVLSAPRDLTGYGSTTGCLDLPNLEHFIVHGPAQPVDQFCILMYKNAGDCRDRPLRFDYLIGSRNLTEARNLPPVQAIKQCSTEVARMVNQ